MYFNIGTKLMTDWKWMIICFRFMYFNIGTKP